MISDEVVTSGSSLLPECVPRPSLARGPKLLHARPERLKPRGIFSRRGRAVLSIFRSCRFPLCSCTRSRHMGRSTPLRGIFSFVDNLYVTLTRASFSLRVGTCAIWMPYGRITRERVSLILGTYRTGERFGLEGAGGSTRQESWRSTDEIKEGGSCRRRGPGEHW